MKIGAAALLLGTALAAPAFADSQGYGNHGGNGAHDNRSGDRDGYNDNDGSRGGYNDRDYGNYNDRDFADHGRFYYGGNVRQRLERLEHWAKFMARSGQLNPWKARRAFEMLREVRFDAFGARRDGYVSPWEKARINRSLDRIVVFLRDARHGGF